MAVRKLERHEKDWVLCDILSSFQIDQSIKKLDMSDRLSFNRYLKTDPEFVQEIKEIELDSCLFLENDMVNLHKKCGGDHKIARIMLEAYTKLLAFRNPAKYSQKIDLNVNQTVSMRVNIEAANQRITGLIRDVIEVGVIEAKK